MGIMGVLVGTVVLLVSHCMVFAFGLIAGVAMTSEIKHKEDKGNDR